MKPTATRPIALTIAGSDSGGGAGIQADLKTFHRFGVFGTSALALITAQNTQGVQALYPLPPEILVQQIESVAEDLRPTAVKTGALGSAGAIEATAEALERLELRPLVVDPVMISKHGAPLLDREGSAALRRLLPLATVLTPNRFEAATLLGVPLDSLRTEAQLAEAARALCQLGPKAALVKGGGIALTPAGDEAVDLLFDGQTLHRFATPRLETTSTHGTGCTYSAALTALLALGHSLPEAVTYAKTFVAKAIAEAPAVGRGRSPVSHWA